MLRRSRRSFFFKSAYFAIGSGVNSFVLKAMNHFAAGSSGHLAKVSISVIPASPTNTIFT